MRRLACSHATYHSRCHDCREAHETRMAELAQMAGLVQITLDSQVQMDYIPVSKNAGRIEVQE